MRQTWGSTTLGQLFTSTKPWSLCLEGERFELSIAGKAVSGAVAQLEKITVKPGAFWAAVSIESLNVRAIALDGIANKKATKLQQALATTIADIWRQERISAWVDQVKRSCWQQLKERGWMSHEFKGKVAASRPVGFEGLLSEPEVEQYL